VIIQKSFQHRELPPAILCVEKNIQLYKSYPEEIIKQFKYSFEAEDKYQTLHPLLIHPGQ